MDAYVTRDTSFGLVLVDINDFRDINSKFGYNTGDLLLQEVAKRLRALCENGEWVARLGEISLPCCNGRERSSSGQRARGQSAPSIKQDIIIDNYPFRLEVGIGIAFFPTDSNQTRSCSAGRSRPPLTAARPMFPMSSMTVPCSTRRPGASILRPTW